MTTTDAPETDDTADAVDLTRTGWVRITLGEQRYRLRRPFLGELRDLRMALEDSADEIMALSSDAIEVANVLKDEHAAIMDEDAGPARTEKLKDLRKRDRERGRDLDREIEKMRIEWWQQVFRVLSLDGVPDDGEWPAWIVDNDLPGRVLTHWRSVPLAHG